MSHAWSSCHAERTIDVAQVVRRWRWCDGSIVDTIKIDLARSADPAKVVPFLRHQISLSLDPVSFVFQNLETDWIADVRLIACNTALQYVSHQLANLATLMTFIQLAEFFSLK